MAQNGFSCTGVEYDGKLVNRLRSLDVNSNYFTVDEFSKEADNTEFDLVHLGDVLEHIAEPRQMLIGLSRRLRRPGGIIMIEGPLEDNTHLALFVRKSVSTILSSIGRGASNHAPYHVTFWNAENQLRLFEECGFQTLTYEVSEQAWPYPSSVGASIGSAISYLVGQISIRASKVVPFRWGNRFTYVGIAR
jgi:2-polyprenyl-3-methyl-5-hydroxy-6-metoxy-1,4-benzoquinol methylase